MIFRAKFVPKIFVLFVNATLLLQPLILIYILANLDAIIGSSQRPLSVGLLGLTVGAHVATKGGATLMENFRRKKNGINEFIGFSRARHDYASAQSLCGVLLVIGFAMFFGVSSMIISKLLS